MKRFEILFGLIKIPLDFVMTVMGFLAAYELRLLTEPIRGIAKPIDYSVLPTHSEYLIFSLQTAAVLIVIFALGKMYSFKTTSKFSQETRKTIILCGIWVMFMVTYFFFTRTFPFSRLATLYSWTLSILFIISGRALLRIIQIIILKLGIGQRILVIIGDNSISSEIGEKLSRDPNYKSVKIISDKSFKQLEYLLKKNHIDEIIQTKSDFHDTQNAKILEFCELNHIQYRFIPDLLDVRRTNIEIDTISGIPIISLKPTPLDGWGKVIKRITDIVGASLGFIILSPLLIITTIAIKIDSKGPVLFSKLDDGSPAKRIGQHGKAFKFYKFRSMYPNTDQLRYTKLADKNIRTDGPLVKIKDDPRITKVGKIIRRYSIDELPQLWNVMIGNMSLVGPRPHLPEEVAKYQKHHHFVLAIKPGLTGIAQTSGRSDLNFEDEVKLDRFYIENWSIWKDVKIILKTIIIVLRRYEE